MGERVVHGVRAHHIQLRVPHTVLLREQEGDKLSRNTWGREEKLSPRPSPLAGEGERVLSLKWGGQGGTPKANRLLETWWGPGQPDPSL